MPTTTDCQEPVVIETSPNAPPKPPRLHKGRCRPVTHRPPPDGKCHPTDDSEKPPQRKRPKKTIPRPPHPPPPPPTTVITVATITPPPSPAPSQPPPIPPKKRPELGLSLRKTNMVWMTMSCLNPGEASPTYDYPSSSRSLS
ncbi:protein O23 [Cercopithecine betaherpesvirus 5]|uniref:Protein O23 n=1 Tax=Simian cytomegalovirus (strain Colburn) TaxID=50292 RepID=G8XTK8_SCMVC|nr:protein O23 [Cercopithecine betaherpesvirus 5]AEV80500.1 protein O23 [Cercopithecine betaherpesvirus 5]